MRYLLFLIAAAAWAKDPILFSFFRNNGEDGLYLAASHDGLKWRVLNQNQPLLQPKVGENKLMRDPSILRGPDGTFHMVWTTSWTGLTLGYASSKDLKHWSEQKVIPVELEASNSWAPELFFDAGQYWIVWASTVKGKFPETAGQGNRDYNHRLYAIHTRDFVTYTKPELFYDPGFQVIDGAVLRFGKRYAMIAKNETLKPEAKYLFVAFADSMGGPWSKAGPAISGKEWAEGPAPVKVGGYWYVYFDKYRDHRYGVIRSKDLVRWEDLSGQLSFPEGARHGTAFTVPGSVLRGLQ